MYQVLKQRAPSTSADGRQFSFQDRAAVFGKAAVAPGYPVDRFRLDACGALIRFDLYGDTTPGGAGWEIDHIYPVAKGGQTVLSNLQPLQWQNNRTKSDSLPGQWVCAVRKV